MIYEDGFTTTTLTIADENENILGSAVWPHKIASDNFADWVDWVNSPGSPLHNAVYVMQTGFTPDRESFLIFGKGEYAFSKLKIRGEADLMSMSMPDPGKFRDFDEGAIPNELTHGCVVIAQGTTAPTPIPREEFLQKYFEIYNLIRVKPFAKCEIWFDCGTTNVKWPESWEWIGDIVPIGATLVPGTRYFIEVLNDGVKTLAKVVYTYSKPN